MGITIVIGIVSGLVGLGMFGFQFLKSRRKTKEKEQTIEELKKKRKKLEDEKENIISEKEEYEEMVSQVRDIIRELQKVVKNGDTEKSRLEDILDRLEKTTLPEKQQILSKLDRIQTKMADDEVLESIGELEDIVGEEVKNAEED